MNRPGIAGALRSISTGQVAVRAAATALKGVRDEAQYGQRTTLDVLNAQQALLNARVDLIGAQRDRVVSSYTALAAVGRLSAERLRLGAELFDLAPHLEAARDKWFGLDGTDVSRAGPANLVIYHCRAALARHQGRAKRCVAFTPPVTEVGFRRRHPRFQRGARRGRTRSRQAATLVPFKGRPALKC